MKNPLLGFLLLAPAFLRAETVDLKGERPLPCKAVRYGGYWILAVDAQRFRIVVADAVASVKAEPPSPLCLFVDLPEPVDDAKPDPQRIRVYPTAKAMARGLLDQGKRDPLPEDTRTRALAALASLVRDKDVEAEVASSLVPEAGEGRLGMALESLKEARPEGMEKRLVAIALGAGSASERRMASEEIKRRSGATPALVLKVLARKESSPRNSCAAADVVGVIRDPVGLDALAHAVTARGVRKTLPPRIPLWRGPTEITDTERMLEGLPPGRHPELTGHVRWLDEEAPPLLVEQEVILPHLLSVLQEAAGRAFKDFDDVESFRRSGGR